MGKGMRIEGNAVQCNVKLHADAGGNSLTFSVPDTLLCRAMWNIPWNITCTSGRPTEFRQWKNAVK